MSKAKKKRALVVVETDKQAQQREKAMANLRRWRADPVAFVREQFLVEPDEWQRDALEAIARNPKVAMSACKGPGKSCLLAWTVWWFLTCHIDAQVIAVSITAANLKDNLWKELAVWQSKSTMLQQAFTFGPERIKSVDRPNTWWVSARAFAQSADLTQQANTLAGFHAKNCLVVLDELGDYPPGVLAAAEAIFANVVNAKLVAAGNPTSTSGPLYSIVMQPKGWVVIFITGDPDDSKRSPRISLDWARSEIDKWGRDNPWVMVNILGLFPPASENQLIAINDVLSAMARDQPLRSYRSDPIVWGLDPARSERATADEAALCRRQGVLARKFITWRGKDGTQLGDAVARLINEAEERDEKPDCVFVDVGGIGSSCYDRLIFLGFDEIVQPVDFGGDADDKRFGNKRCEMWWSMADWVRKKPSCLPSDSVLQGELVAPTFWFGTKNKQTCFWLESKDDMKKRGVPSPNRADALALTFAAPVAAKGKHAREAESGRQRFAETDYNPFRHAGESGGQQKFAKMDYDPFKR